MYSRPGSLLLGVSLLAEAPALARVSRRVPTFRLGAGLENGTNAGHSGAESGRRGLPPADTPSRKTGPRCLE